MKTTFTTLLILFTILVGTAQRTTRRTRPHLPPTSVSTTQAETNSMPAADTIAADSLSFLPLRLSGFDKTLASHHESFFAQNRGDSATIVWMSLTIDYFDDMGRQLHRRKANIECSIPPRQTRRVDIPTWDKQNVYFYKHSEPRRKVLASAAPFDIRVRIDSLALARK